MYALQLQLQSKLSFIQRQLQLKWLKRHITSQLHEYLLFSQHLLQCWVDVQCQCQPQQQAGLVPYQRLVNGPAVNIQC